MKTIGIHPLKTTLGLLLLAALAMPGARAAVLHGIPGGDCTSLPDGITGTVSDQSGNAAGWWTTYQGWEAATGVSATGTGAARHIEMHVGWRPEEASVWYTDYGTTPATAAWNISSDLKWAGGSSAQLSLELFADEFGAQRTFGIYFTGTAVSWAAGGQTGNFASATGLDNSWRTLSVVYNPLTGWATGSLGAEQIFNVNAGTALFVKRVQVNDNIADGQYDSSILSVDNITASNVPEPAALGLLALGGALLLRRRR